jgi:hypothetical protein
MSDAAIGACAQRPVKSFLFQQAGLRLWLWQLVRLRQPLEAPQLQVHQSGRQCYAAWVAEKASRLAVPCLRKRR